MRRPDAAIALGVGHHGFDLLYSAEHRAKRDEIAVRQARNDARQRGLADAGRSPEDDGAELVALDLDAQRLARAEDVLLADELIERRRTHPFGQRPGGVFFDARQRVRLKQAHVDMRCLCAI